MASQEDKEEKEYRDTQRAIAELAKFTKQIKKKNWERYKDIFPELYAEEFGTDRSIDPQLRKIIDREREKAEKIKEKIDDMKEENSRLKEDIKELEKINRRKDKDIEKMSKEIKKRDEDIIRLNRAKRETKN